MAWKAQALPTPTLALSLQQLLLLLLLLDLPIPRCCKDDPPHPLLIWCHQMLLLPPHGIASWRVGRQGCLPRSADVPLRFWPLRIFGVVVLLLLLLLVLLLLKLVPLLSSRLLYYLW